jgi:hypothetical protein
LIFAIEIADGSDEFIVDSIDMFLQQTPEFYNIYCNAINAHGLGNSGIGIA